MHFIIFYIRLSYENGRNNNLFLGGKSSLYIDINRCMCYILCMKNLISLIPPEVTLIDDDTLAEIEYLIEHEHRSIRGALTEFGVPYSYFFHWKRSELTSEECAYVVARIESAYERGRSELKRDIANSNDSRAKVSLLQLESEEMRRDEEFYGISGTTSSEETIEKLPESLFGEWS